MLSNRVVDLLEPRRVRETVASGIHVLQGLLRRRSALDVTRVDGLAGLDAHAAELDRLNAVSERPTPFSSAEYLRAYALHDEHARSVGGVHLFLVRDGARLIGVCPLRSVESSFGQLRERKLELWTTHDSEQIRLSCLPRDEARVAVALVDHLTHREPRWGMVELSGQRPGGALHRAVHDAVDLNFRARDIAVEPCTEVALSFPSLEAYFRAFTKKMRSNVSRQTRHLYAAGDVQLVLAQGAEAASRWFDAYVNVDSHSWKANTESSIQRHPARVEFFRELLNGRAGMEPSFVGVVLDGILTAGLIVGSGRFPQREERGSWCLEMAYDNSTAELGGGQLLLLLAAGAALERKDAYLNYLQNFAYYKHRWLAEPTEVTNLQLIRRISLHNVRATAGDAKRWLKAHRNAAPSTDEAGPRHSDSEIPEAADDFELAPTSTMMRKDAGRSRALTAVALAERPPGSRVLDRQAASAYLPFPLA